MQSRKRVVLILGGLSLCLVATFLIIFKKADMFNKKMFNKVNSSSEKIVLPPPRYDSTTSIEEALLKRRSVRNYQGVSLTLAEVSQILWSAQGVTDKKGYRTAPSAGALYPLEVYLVVGEVEGMAGGVYKYVPADHELVNVALGDKRGELQKASLDQSSVGDAPVILVISAVYERTTIKYGERGVRYVHLEAGHAAQNVYLQAVSLDLGAVVMGAFDDAKVKTLLNMLDNEEVLYIMPIGKR